MAKGTRQRGKSQGAEITIQIKEPAGRTLGTPSRKGTRSVIKVSQLLLRAIADQPRLTLAELKKELGNAGYEVCQNIKGDNRDSTRSERGTLLWVSGSDTTGYFRVWKVPKSRKKVGQSWLVLGRRSSRKTLLQSRSRSTSPRLRRPRSRRKAAKKAREFWNHKSRIFKAKSRITRSMVRKRIRSRAKSRARSRGRSRARSRAKAQVCARAQEQACARSKEQARARARTQKCVQGREQECTNTREEAHMGARMQTRARAMDNIRAGPSREDGRSRSKNERRPNSKSRDEKRQEPERVVKRTIQKPAVAIVKSVSCLQGKAPTKASAKSDSPGCSRNP